METFKPKTENEIRKSLEKAMRDPGARVSRLTTNIMEVYDRGETKFIDCKTLKIYVIPPNARTIHKGRFTQLGVSNLEMARELIKTFCK